MVLGAPGPDGGGRGSSAGVGLMGTRWCAQTLTSPHSGFEGPNVFSGC